MFYKRKLETDFRSYASITADVGAIVEESGVREGICLIFVPHTTASLVITSFWDPRGLEDLMDEIDRNIPTRVSYKHQDSPYDASGHVKSALIGSSASLIIHNGELVLGSSQGLVLVEHDGPRPREFYVQIAEAEPFVEKISVPTVYMGMHDLTLRVQAVVDRSGAKEGICHISVLHSTAGLVLTDRDASALQDVMEDIERMVPTRVDFKHRETASDAGGHVKTALTGTQLTVPVVDGKLLLGKEQAIVFAEFDGPRPRSCVAAVYETKGEGRETI